MSFILDALRKSEHERQRQAGPAIAEMPIARPASRLPVALGVIGALLAVNLAVLLYFMLRQDAPEVQREEAVPAAAASAPVPLISAIGASIFLQNAAQLLFGPQRRNYTNPVLLERGTGWNVPVGESTVMITYTGVFSFVLSVLLMIGLYLLVQRTKLGRAMRAVAQDKKTAALMAGRPR